MGAASHSSSSPRERGRLRLRRRVDDDGRGCTLLTVFDIATRRPVFGPVPTPIQGGDLAIDPTAGSWL